MKKKSHDVSFKKFTLSFRQRVHFGTLATRLFQGENVASVPAKALEVLLLVPDVIAMLNTKFPGQLAETLVAQSSRIRKSRTVSAE